MLAELIVNWKFDATLLGKFAVNSRFCRVAVAPSIHKVPLLFIIQFLPLNVPPERRKNPFPSSTKSLTVPSRVRRIVPAPERRRSGAPRPIGLKREGELRTS